ncbi:unnamed protein product [Adineta steineri]|uniref:F-box domain-containing protein n=1 Tax=Adineta steineri TaxID=433720 RepID=A0A818H7F1_9BILA|nr:unnamed protein product [Adineta steineri]CAF3501971.1 unnamed protein product [Adineta steineri]
MNRSNIHLLDLPDEILLIILKKLNNIDVLYSLFDINNGRLDILAQGITFTDILKFISIDNIPIIDRFCIDILPRINHNVKCFAFDPVFMERILLATDYPNLTKLTIIHFQKAIALNYFTDESSLRSIFQEQITNLILISDDENEMECLPNIYAEDVYADILIFFKNLKKLSFVKSSVVLDSRLPFYYSPCTTFSSPILTHLYINVETLDDCFYLLDGRLRKLTTLCVNVHHMDTFSGYGHNINKKLLNLKYFALKSSYAFQKYDIIVLLLRRMSNLEKLTLNISMEGRNSIIDGSCVQHDILDHMPQLRSFTFYICTYIGPITLPYKLSSEDIQQTLTNIGQQHVSSIVNYFTGCVNSDFGIGVACSMFSLPFEFDYLQDLGNRFPSIVFSYVTYLVIRDIIPFEHEFFMRIARFFPLLKHLCIRNKKSQELDGLMTFSSDNCQLHSIIEYPHLAILDVKFSDTDYVEQFLNETKTFIPCLTELGVSFVDDLKAVTKDFTREETRRNCSKMKIIHCLLFSLFVSISWSIDGQLIKEDLNKLLNLDCSNPMVILHVFSATPNPVWMINIKQIIPMKNLVKKILNDYENHLLPINSTRTVGYQGFTISCSTDNEIFIHGLNSLENQLLESGKSYLSKTIIEHVSENLGKSLFLTKYTSLTRINCDLVPIKGSDKVPTFSPQTGNGGCFVKKQSKNNCYAYGTNIVTNTYPQPGRYSGTKLSAITCETVRKAAVLDGLVYYGTNLPVGHPKSGHFVALLLWPNADYHWIRKDATGFWSHKPGAGAVTNKDNTGSLINNPSKSNLSPWKSFCGYYIAQPSKINIR